jgi:hypothetical protein
MAHKRKRPGIVRRNDAITLRRIAHAGGVIVTHCADGGVVYTLRASGDQIRTETVQRLIDCRALVREDRGLLDAHPQSYRTRVPADGKL